MIGCGGVGMTAVALLSATSKAKVVAIDPDPAKREAALKHGAALAFDPSAADALKTIGKACNMNIAGAVDFVGAESSSSLAVNLVRRTGQVVIVGLFGGEFRMPLPMFALKSLRISGSYVAGLNELRELVALAQRIDAAARSRWTCGRWPASTRRWTTWRTAASSAAWCCSPERSIRDVGAAAPGPRIRCSTARSCARCCAWPRPTSWPRRWPCWWAWPRPSTSALLGVVPLAALGLVFPFAMLTGMLSAGAMGGGVSSALAAPSAPATRRARSRWRCMRCSIGTLGGVLYSLLFLAVAAPLFTLLGGRGEVLREALAYATVLFSGALGGVAVQHAGLDPARHRQHARALAGAGRRGAAADRARRRCSAWASGRCRGWACPAWRWGRSWRRPSARPGLFWYLRSGGPAAPALRAACRCSASCSATS